MILTVLAVAIAFSGCVYVENLLQPTPTPRPVVTIMPTPTPMPTVTPTPMPVAPQKSSDVKILSMYGEKGMTNFSFIKDSDYQKEFITVMVRNEGDTTAKNVILGLTLTDAHTADPLLQQQFKVGDMARGETRNYVMETDKHGLSNSIYIVVSITWGENGEYISPVTYVDLPKTIWL